MGKEATKFAFVFYLTNRVQNALIIRCFTNAIEEIVNVIAFYYYLKLTSSLTRDTLIFTGLLSVQFMIRNTAPIGWIPLLFIRVFKDGAFCSFLGAAILVAVPIVVLAIYFDSLVYAELERAPFRWVVTGYNFIVVNLVEDRAKYFGDHPTWFYVGAFLPAIFNVVYPISIYSVVYYMRDSWAKGQSPDMMYMTCFYIIIFSIISHKEKRFMLPIVPFVFLAIGYTLVRKVKTWRALVYRTLVGSAIVEIAIFIFYSIHHNLYVFTDHILARAQSEGTHPHSLYTEKRYD